MEFKKKIDDGILEKLVHINRITKVVKGGLIFLKFHRQFSF